MIIRQFYHRDSYTYSYVLLDKSSKRALVIDSVRDMVPSYLSCIEQLDCQLIFALDTHVHADHITGMGRLRQLTACETLIGQQASVFCIDRTFNDGELIRCGDIVLQAIYTPGHTDDSYCFYMQDDAASYLFSGDTLFIGGTGRTDFQSGSSQALFDSLFNKILLLPNTTILYPGHDYNGLVQSTLGEERLFNPRLQVDSWQELAIIMDNLNLPKPKMMDIAIPCNRRCGECLEESDLSKP